MTVPVIGMAIFAAFFIVAIWKRRKPAVHRALMLVATLSLIPAAVARIDAISNLYIGTVWESLFGPFFGTLVIGIVLLIINSNLTRSFDKVYAIGLALLAIASILILKIARTSAWDSFANFLLQ
jgi:hypothetical protein